MLISEMRELLAKGAKLSDLPLRVTFYGRVSTDLDEQLSSLDHQQAYFIKKIEDTEKWIYVPGYIDEGITGTSVKKRKAFLRMIEDAKDGMFDLILTKEVSRFARDIVDSIQYTRLLLQYNVGVLFEDINLNTIEPDAEFRLSIMATVAQEESRKISERTKFGHRQGSIMGKRHGQAPLGYVLNDETNGFSIDPEKCEVVKYVFRRYAEDKVGLSTISKELYEMGYKSSTGTYYTNRALARVIQNPVYTGNIVTNKTTNVSYRERVAIERPKSEWLIFHDENRVPPLVSQELWDRCNEVFERRSGVIKAFQAKEIKTRKSTKHPYSGRIKCVEHDMYFSHGCVGAAAERSNKSDYYQCPEYKRHGRKGCSCPRLTTRSLNELMRQVFGCIRSKNRPESINDILASIEEAMVPETVEKELGKLNQQKAALEAKKAKLVKGWFDNVIDDATYKELSQAIASELDALDKKQEELQSAHEKMQETVNDFNQLYDEIARMMDLSNDQMLEGLVRRYVREIRVVKSEENPEQHNLEVYLSISDTPILAGHKRDKQPLQISEELRNALNQGISEESPTNMGRPSYNGCPR